MRLHPLMPDVPLPLGEHLDELRRRLIWPVILFGVVFLAAFSFDSDLKQIFVQPLLHAMSIADAADPGASARAGIVIDPEHPMRLLKTFDLGESMWVSMSLALWAASVVTIPFVVYQLYMFIATGLTAKERNLAFLFVPVAVMCFYTGIAFGYYLGMPYFFAWFIAWTANDPISTFELRLDAYRDSFFFYTLMFGLLFDVPWAVVTICRVGLTTPQTLAKYRKFIFFGSTVLSALIAPGDFFSMIAVMFPTYLLFEIGLLAAYIVGGPKKKEPERG
jgi:sec-independent protein translocase protein TatC